MSAFSLAIALRLLLGVSRPRLKIEVGRACLRYSDSILDVKILMVVKNLPDLSPCGLAYWLFFFSVGTRRG